MKLVLVGIDLRDTIVSLTLPQLAAHLRGQADLSAGVQVDTHIFSPRHSALEIAQHVIATRPDVLGLSLFVWSEPVLTTALRRICAALPELRVVAGGPQVQARADYWLREFAPIAAVIEGEGERPLAALLRRLTADRPLDGIAGVHARASGDAIAFVPPEPPPPIATLRQMPSAYLAGCLRPLSNVAYVETARGCPFHCGYCDFGHQYRQIRKRRLSVVEQELRWLRDHGVTSLVFIDPVFNAEPRRPLTLLRLARRLGFGGISAQIRAELLDEPLAAELGRCQALVGVGLQSTNPAAQRLMGRACPADRFRRGIGWLKQHKVAFKLHLVCGLPGDTYESFCDSLDAALALDPIGVEAFTLQVLPGTRFHRNAAQLGLSFDPLPPHEVFQTRTMDQRTLLHARLVGMLAFQLHCRRRVRAQIRAAVAAGARPSTLYQELAQRALAADGLPIERLLIAGESYSEDDVRRLCALLDRIVRERRRAAAPA